MKYQITRSNEVGKANFGWLQAKYYFSFANYYNPDKMGFGKLRVINDDSIEPGQGFDTHAHKDMEIITIPLSGAVLHKDNQGHESVIRPGEIQVMSAGRGIFHSEFNNSSQESLKLFQIWIEPSEYQVDPRYDQHSFDLGTKEGEWTQLVSPMNQLNEKGLKIHQNAYVNGVTLLRSQKITYDLKNSSHGVFLLVASGKINIDNHVLSKRDAIAISEIVSLIIEAIEDAEVFLIEVPLS